MAHPQQTEFFKLVATTNHSLIPSARVLEIGSYNVNGSIRDYFGLARHYTGVDLTEGPGVDQVGFGHELDYPDGFFDITLSGECFEHDPHWRDTFINMARMTKPGGLVVFSCASHGRLEHGTLRTTKAHSPGTQAVGLDYYRNLNADDFDSIPMAAIFSKYRFWYQAAHHDLYFVGIKQGGDKGARIPQDVEIEHLRHLMPFRKRVMHAGMRILATVLPDHRYQALAIRVKELVA